MNKRILETLEFNQVKQQISQYLVTAQGQEELRDLLPVTDIQVITAWLEETEDGIKAQRLRGGIPVPKIENIRPI